MENKVLKIFLVIAVVIMIVMGVMIYKINSDKIATQKEVAELKNEAKVFETTIEELNEKIENISTILNTSDEDKKEMKIEGEYKAQSDELESETYTFTANKVEHETLSLEKGTFEIEDDKIKITYTEAYDPERKKLDVEDFPNGENDKLTIIDENTLEKNGVKFIKK